ncbi:MAG TPA: hypothetical protein VGS41_02150 [Chthonomonadales bacterium]|nr:hypothetical protein [Chthonomonadales bacterium]
MKLNKVVGPIGAMAALLVFMLTVACIQRAVAVAAVPGDTVIPYSLAAGASSSPVTPVADKPVFIYGSNTTPGDRGCFHISLEHAPGQFLELSGMNSTSSTNAIPILTGGLSSVAGTVMAQIDWNNNTPGVGVFLQIASPDSFLVHNATSITQTGTLQMIN